VIGSRTHINAAVKSNPKNVGAFQKITPERGIQKQPEVPNGPDFAALQHGVGWLVTH
jgi:hypothetical protein